MEQLPDIPGSYVLIYKISIVNNEDFQKLRKQLFSLVGVKEVLLQKKPATYRVIVLTNGYVSDTRVRLMIRRLGYQATSEKLPHRQNAQKYLP